jgi:hypothetical protein
MFNLLVPIVLISTALRDADSFLQAHQLVAQLAPGTGLKQAQSPVTSTNEVSKTQETNDTIIPVALPINAKVLLKQDGLTTGQVKGFDAKQQSMTLGEESIQLARIEKVIFDRKALAYKSDGKSVFRGPDTAKAEQLTWTDVLLSAFQLKDPKLGQAQVNLAGIIEPKQLKGMKSVAKNSVYLVDEIQFQSAGKMTIKVTPADR